MADKDNAAKPDKPKVKTSKSAAPKSSTDLKPKVSATLKAKAEPEVKVVASPVAPASSGNATVTSATKPKPAAIGPGKRWLRSVWVRVVAAVVAVLLVVIIVFAVLIYAFSSTSQLTYAVSKVIPYPAERVNGHFVSYRSYLFEVNANQKAYVSNAKLNNQTVVAWTSADGKKLLVQIKQHALTKLEDDALTAQLAKKYKVSVSDKDVNNLINTLYQKYGGKDTLLKTLSQIYGWNLNDLKGVITKQLLSQKVQAAVASDPVIDKQTKAKATDVLAKLKAGADFAATAKQYSQASDASSGGDLGTVTKGQVEDAVYNAASALQPNTLSDVIKTQYGYQIIEVLSKTDANIHLEHVLIENVNYGDYFSAQEKAAKVHTFVKV